MQKNKNNKYYRGEYNEESKSPIIRAEKIELAEEDKDNVCEKELSSSCAENSGKFKQLLNNTVKLVKKWILLNSKRIKTSKFHWTPKTLSIKVMKTHPLLIKRNKNKAK